MANRAEKKIAKKVSLGNAYTKYYNSQLEEDLKGNKRPRRSTWTRAQWDTATPAQRELAKSGASYKRIKRFK
jgi:hypothetical protein